MVYIYLYICKHRHHTKKRKFEVNKSRKNFVANEGLRRVESKTINNARDNAALWIYEASRREKTTHSAM